MNLTKSELKLFEYLLDKYGKDEPFVEDDSSLSKYVKLIASNILDFSFIYTNDEIIYEYKINSEFYRKYIRTKKLSNFLSPS